MTSSDNPPIAFHLGPDAGSDWSAAMLEHHGLYCQFDEAHIARSSAQSWHLGDIGVTRADLVSLALVPAGEEQGSWQGQWLYLKLMTGGRVDIEQGGNTHRFTAGSMFFIDPERSFHESFAERGQMTILRIPKGILRERGLMHSLRSPVIADMGSADTRAIRDLIQCIAQQHVAPGPAVRKLMGRQLLELVDSMLGGAGDKARPRSADAVLSRARRHIHLHLADPRLDCTAVAEAAHVSVKHLQRLFREQNTTLMRHVWSVRLEHAQRLLTSTSVRPSVQDVAWKSGFATASHFSRAYQAQFGICPSQVGAAR
ncbi:AraC family transcriptional regulator [Pseudomonas sp. MM211]|uniref:AraC family transcriptional regulator n=1 Tax=Pseudomonas sp. MM211 TaxID=2866808 RepID=UPI001CEC05B7|nr:AraC family transcriptional regulator [Pseudomonas sp. MM211]UCJ14790.1 AraC family transcriptional regulator [Pseudomonas sp. MM211]